MCGIAGIWCTEYSEGKAAIQTMNRAQAHRGPNDEGVEFIRLSVGHLLLGHRRLSILDLSPSGHQPMVNPATGDWIVFNGEIYNYRELKAELQAGGASFSSNSDTEVILQAFARWGTDSIARLQGMFAFGLYRAATRSMVLARDAMGIKPLYYCWTKSAFLFASEVRAIEATGITSREVDRQALAGLLAYGALQSPCTLSKEVRSLEPGCWLELKLDQELSSQKSVRAHRYWNFPGPRESLDVGEIAEEEVHKRLIEVTRQHLLSDVPVGVFLSSGLDSSAIASICGEVGANLETFTVSIADSDFDENPIAEHTAASLGYRHHKIAIPSVKAASYVSDWLNAFDQPSFDGLNTFIVANAVRQQGIVVALSGLGGDELFGGYSTFQQVPKALNWLRRLSSLPLGLRQTIAVLAFGLGSAARRQKALEFAGTEPDLAALYFRRRRLLSDRDLTIAGLSNTSLGLGKDYQPEGSSPAGLPPMDPFTSISMLECRYYMGNMLLRDSDVCGMANGLEIRVPFVDRRLVEYVCSIPKAYKQGRGTKPLLRRALANTVPRKVLDLPKTGFSLPHAGWMLGPLRGLFEDGLRMLRLSGLIEGPCIDQVWTDFIRNPSGPDWSRAWMLGVLGHWYERWRKSSTLKKVALDSPP
jgi:asparagine synthase (glutamine-hydrolysing)